MHSPTTIWNGSRSSFPFIRCCASSGPLVETMVAHIILARVLLLQQGPWTCSFFFPAYLSHARQLRCPLTEAYCPPIIEFLCAYLNHPVCDTYRDDRFPCSTARLRGCLFAWVFPLSCDLLSIQHSTILCLPTLASYIVQSFGLGPWMCSCIGGTRQMDSTRQMTPPFFDLTILVFAYCTLLDSLAAWSTAD